MRSLSDAGRSRSNEIVVAISSSDYLAGYFSDYITELFFLPAIVEWPEGLYVIRGRETNSNNNIWAASL